MWPVLRLICMFWTIALVTVQTDAQVHEVIAFKVHFKKTGWKSLLYRHSLTAHVLSDACTTLDVMLRSSDPLYHVAWVTCDQHPLTLNVTSNTVLIMYLDAKMLGLTNDSFKCIEDIAKDLMYRLELGHKGNKVPAIERVTGIPKILRLHKYKLYTSVSEHRGMLPPGGFRQQDVFDVKFDLLRNWIPIVFQTKPRVVQYVSSSGPVFSLFQTSFDMYFDADATNMTEEWHRVIHPRSHRNSNNFSTSEDRLYVKSLLSLERFDELERESTGMKVITHLCVTWRYELVQDIAVEGNLLIPFAPDIMQTVYDKAGELVPRDLYEKLGIVDVKFGAFNDYKDISYWIISTNKNHSVIEVLQNAIDKMTGSYFSKKVKLLARIRNCSIYSTSIPVIDWFIRMPLKFATQYTEFPQKYTSNFTKIGILVNDMVRSALRKHTKTTPLDVRLEKLAFIYDEPMAYVRILIDPIDLTRQQGFKNLYEYAKTETWERNASDTESHLQFIGMFNAEMKVRCDVTESSVESSANSSRLDNSQSTLSQRTTHPQMAQNTTEEEMMTRGSQTADDHRSPVHNNTMSSWKHNIQASNYWLHLSTIAFIALNLFMN